MDKQQAATGEQQRGPDPPAWNSAVQSAQLWTPLLSRGCWSPPTKHHSMSIIRPLSHWKLISKFMLICSFRKKISTVKVNFQKK